ncbi:MAG: GntR family transcriptional regulator [Armatimonadota bacterium]|nr:GntR family transcriptional regulator [Armatimonadota bacterium]MDR7453194.1 GntR family transcriptional regulator [Armatimonadota bacterium]MDR7456854.1 GntR family transcriptional regulator [Armatimonadota bacterium]MDR7495521.1 GntR family transcriptional regulator [Armatimonadota bacterium]
MRLSLDRGGTVPLVAQLKAQIRHEVASGRLSAGARLPTVRTLAGFLRVNRNTVARAYAALEAEGVLDARPGRGTRVAARPAAPRGSRLLAARIDRLLSAADEAGVPLDDLIAMLTVRAGRRREAGRPRLGFVECNPVDLAYFSRLVRDAVEVPVVPMRLDELPRRLAEVDLVATTFFHVEEARRAVRGVEVVGLMALPDFATLEEIARLPRALRVALVCATREGATSKARSLAAVGLRPPRLRSATLGDPGLVALLGRSDVLLAAPRVLARVREAVPRRVRVIPFASVLSEGAVALLHERIAAWRARRGALAVPA